MKDKDSKKPKQAKIIKLKNTNIQTPLDNILKDLEQINQTLESHWKEEQTEEKEEDLDVPDFRFWKLFDVSFICFLISNLLSLSFKRYRLFISL